MEKLSNKELRPKKNLEGEIMSKMDSKITIVMRTVSEQQLEENRVEKRKE